MFRRLPARTTQAVYWRWMRAVTATLRPFRRGSGKWRGMADHDLGEHRLVLPRVQPRARRAVRKAFSPEERLASHIVPLVHGEFRRSGERTRKAGAIGARGRRPYRGGVQWALRLDPQPAFRSEQRQQSQQRLAFDRNATNGRRKGL